MGPIGPVLFTPNDSDDTNTPDNTDIPQYDDDEILLNRSTLQEICRDQTNAVVYTYFFGFSS